MPEYDVEKYEAQYITNDDLDALDELTSYLEDNYSAQQNDYSFQSMEAEKLKQKNSKRVIHIFRGKI